LSANVHEALEELQNLDESQLLPQREAEELFHLPDGVQVPILPKVTDID
jgi:hypothetical protein